MAGNRQIKRKVFALGETVLDLVSTPAKRSEEFFYPMQAIPGGSVLNASVSLGRMGINISLISEFGADKAGNLIDEFLIVNGVETNYCIRHAENKTSLALAFLDKEKKASYSFYHDSPENIQNITTPDLNEEDILLFGSYYAVKPNRRNLILKVLQKAVEAGSTIYYDLNIRKAHAGEIGNLMPSFLNNMAVASIVKGSDEDFFLLYGVTDAMAVYERINRFCKVLIVTNGSKPLQVVSPKFCRSYDIGEIIPVSTIGAGDNFNAGFIFGLATSEMNVKNIADLPASELDRITGCGLAFAAETCLSAENYIKGDLKQDFWKKYI